MNFEKTIDMFVEYLEKELKEQSSVTYKRKIVVFYEYVTKVLQAKDVNFQSILTAMRVEQLLEALDFYIVNYKIEYATTAWNYYFAISSFFQFLYNKFGWENKLFENKSENADLKKAYEERIKELELNTSEQVLPLSDDEAKRLVALCDEKLSITDEEIMSGYYTGDFSNYISSIICKIILLYGTKNKVINEMKITDYNSTLNKLKINDIWVHLPDNLALQMLRYMDIREKLIDDETDERLFVDIAKNKDKLDYTKIFNVLKELLGHNKGKVIAKYSIVQMIRSGISSHLIKEFTGYSDNVYNHCLEIVNEDGIVMMREKNKLLDSTFRKQELFDLM